MHRVGSTRALGVAVSLFIHAALIALWLWSPSMRRVSVPPVVDIQLLPPAVDVSKNTARKEVERPQAPRDRIHEEPVPIRVFVEAPPALPPVEIPSAPAAESDVQVHEAAAPPVAVSRASEERTSSSDYAAQLARKLEQVKRYPDTARANRQTGTVLLSFTLERSGRLLAWHIARSSGYDALDSEAGAMIAKATPFPPFPDSLAKPSESFIVPIEFSRN